MSDPDTGVPRTVGPLASAGRFKVKAAASVATPNPQPGQMEARVTHAKLRFADGSGVEIDFSQGRSIDDALSALRMASTGDTRPTPDGEIGELVDGDNFPKVRHWFFQALSPEDRQGFLEAWYGLPRSVTSATSINLQHQMLKHAYRPPALETQAADIARLQEALETARDKFDFYEQCHRLKCTAEGDEKADRNRELVEMIDAALATRTDAR